MSHTKNWYIRRKGGPLKGPFPSGQIEQYLLLGRFVVTDEVSLDKIEWHKISSIPKLIPELLISAKYDEAAQQKLASKKRWADERRGLNNEKPGDDRRNVETKDNNRHAAREQTIKKQKLLIAYMQVAVVFLILTVIAFLSFRFMPENVVSVANCSTTPAININWTHCKRVGIHLSDVDMSKSLVSSATLTGAVLVDVDLTMADLSYTELSISKMDDVIFSNAILVGLIIRNSTLTNVDFYKSDLRYADFSGTIIKDTNFSEANLSNAIWVDGRKCAKNSIGLCR